MAQTSYLHAQAERCRRLARDSTDVNLRDTLLQLAKEFTARADAQVDEGNDESASIRCDHPDDKGDT